MNIADVMDQIGDRLDTITGLRVHRYPPGAITPPAAFVEFPEDYTFDATYGRGMDRLTLPVSLAISPKWSKAARDLLAGYLSGSGDSSVKAVLESGTYTAFHTVRVTSAVIEGLVIGDVTYMGITFELDIAGPGSN